MAAVEVKQLAGRKGGERVGEADRLLFPGA